MQASSGIYESRLHIRCTDLLHLKVGQGTGIVKRYSRAWTQRLRCSHMSKCIQGPFFKRLYKIMNLKLKSRTGDFVSIWLNGRIVKGEFSTYIKSNQIQQTGKDKSQEQVTFESHEEFRLMEIGKWAKRYSSKIQELENNLSLKEE